MANQGCKKIKDVNAQNVTFSERRSGLFIKASELCTLCTVQMFMVVFSPRGKTFVFGHPSSDDIIDKFFGSDRGPDSNRHLTNETKLKFLNEQYSSMRETLYEERNGGRELKLQRRSDQSHRWVNTLIDELNLDGLEKQAALLTNLRVGIEEKKEELLIENSCPTQISHGMSDLARPFDNICDGSFSSSSKSTPTPSLSMSNGPNVLFSMTAHSDPPYSNIFDPIPPSAKFAKRSPTTTPCDKVVVISEPSPPIVEKIVSIVNPPEAKPKHGLNLDLNFPPPMEE